jgi:hypothetical protein
MTSQTITIAYLIGASVFTLAVGGAALVVVFGS